MTQTGSTLKPKEWVKNYSDTLYRFAVLRVNDEEMARDLIQETFLAALRNVESYRGEISEKNWLFTILKNKIIDHYRKKASTLVSEIDGLLDSAKECFDDEEHWKESAYPNDWKVDYQTPVESEEFHEILNKCINKLSELMKIVFTMKYLDEKESEEICKELQISTSNYWVVMHRAKLQLRSCLEKKWFGK